MIVRLGVGLLQNAHTDFEKAVARHGFIETDGSKLLYRSRNRAVRASDNSLRREDVVPHFGRDAIEPKAIEVFIAQGQAADYPGLIEAGAAIKSLLRIDEVDFRV